VGVIDIGLTPEFLDSPTNIVTAHRRTCNKESELDLQGSIARLRDLGVKELPRYLPAIVQELWGKTAELSVERGKEGGSMVTHLDLNDSQIDVLSELYAEANCTLDDLHGGVRAVVLPIPHACWRIT
jgi:hypothetical protein